MICADGQQRNLGRELFADSSETFKIRTVTGVINAATLVFKNETAITAMMVAQGACAPVFARSERHLPVLVPETFPPIEFDDSFETEVVSEIAHAPGHHTDFRMRQPPDRGFVEMIEVRVGEQHQVNGWQMFDFQPGTSDSLNQKQPVGKVWINQNVQIRELNQKGRVADPGDCHLPAVQLGKNRLFVAADARRQQNLPDHFLEKGARIEMVGWSQVFKRPWQTLSRQRWSAWSGFFH